MGEADVPPADRDAVVAETSWLVRLAYGVVTDPQASAVSYFSGQKEGRDRAGQRPHGKATGKHQVHASATRAAGFSRPPISDRQKLLGVVHRSVKCLPPLQQTWIRFAYCPPGVAQQEAAKAFYRGYTELFAALHLGTSRVGTRTRMREMVDTRMRQWTGLLPWSAQYQPLRGELTPQEWKTIKPYWHRICGELTTIDADALYAIGIDMEGE